MGSVDVEEITVPRAAAYALLGGVVVWALAAVLVSLTSTPPWVAAVGGLAAVAALHLRIQWVFSRRLAASWGQHRAARWMTWGLGVAATAWMTWALAAKTVLAGNVVVALLLLALIAWAVMHPLMVSLPDPIQLAVPSDEDEPEGTDANKSVSPQDGTGEPSDRGSWQDILALKGIGVIEVVSVEPFAAGYTASVQSVEGDLEPLFAPKIPDRIATGAARRWPELEVNYGSVVIERGVRAGTAQVRLMTRDVLAEERLRPPCSDVADILVPWSPGRLLDGTPIKISLAGHGQIIGASQSGKSTTMELAIEYVSRCFNAIPCVGGSWKLANLVSGWLTEVEAGQSGQTPFGWIAPTVKSTLELMASLWQYADNFFSIPASQRPSKPTREWPAIVLFLDELHRLIESNQKIVCHDGIRRDASDLIEVLTSGATGAFVYVALASQRGTNGHFGLKGGDIKANLSWHLAFRSHDPADLARVIPDVTYGMSNTNLEHPGSAYVKVGKQPPMLGKMDRLRSVPASARAVAGLGGTWPARAGEVMTVADGAFSRRWKSSPEEFLAYVYSGRETAESASGEKPSASPAAPEEMSPARKEMHAAFAKLHRNTARRRMDRELTDDRVDEAFGALTTMSVLADEPAAPVVPPPAQTPAVEPPAATETTSAAPARRLPQPLQSILDALTAHPELVLTTASGTEMVAAKDLVVAIGKVRSGDTPAIAREGAALTRELKKRWGIEGRQEHIPGVGTVRGYLVAALRKAGEAR